MCRSTRRAAPSVYARDVSAASPESVHRHNGLNVVRLLLAAGVLFAHALLVAGVPAPEGTDIGYWSVAGFFCISGYLVTRSATRLPARVFLRHRLARLMPAYWACLLVTGLLLAPLAASRLSAVTDGVLYSLANAGLVVTRSSIGGTPDAGNYPGEWNASLWTLPHELACYLVAGVVVWRGAAAKLPRAVWVIGWLVALCAHVAVLRVVPEAPFLLRGFLRLLPLFMGGAVIQAIVPLERMSARTGAAALAVAGLAATTLPAYGLQAAAPALAYGLLAVGTRLPCPRFVATEDVSYGTYLYAFPVTQLLAAYWLPSGPPEVGAWLLTIAAITLCLAAASWWGVEKRALSWARRPSAASTGSRRGEHAAALRSSGDGRR